jgi:hypothetical protein
MVALSLAENSKSHAGSSIRHATVATARQTGTRRSLVPSSLAVVHGGVDCAKRLSVA